jgi:enamidase
MLELLIEAGFSLPRPKDLLSNAAEYAGRDKDIGSIEEGQRADLVLIDGDTKGHSCGKKYGNRFEKWIGYDSKKYLS